MQFLRLCSAKSSVRIMRHVISRWAFLAFKLILVSAAANGTVSPLIIDRRNSTASSVESSRDLCLQAIQEAIIQRTADIFVDVRRSDGFQRPFVLYQMAEHGNYGDTFIDRGEELWLARHGIQPAAECSDDNAKGQHRCNEKGIEDLVKSNATVLFQGGGNWGDLWYGNHIAREHALRQLAPNPGMTLVTMPQSLKWSSRGQRKASEQAVAEIMAKKSEDTRIIFLFRQRDSFVEAQKMYPSVDIRLVPDAAFMIGPLSRVSSNDKFKYDIIFLLRGDKENSAPKAGAGTVHTTMAKLAPSLSYYIGDWSGNPTNETLYYFHSKEEPTIPSMRHSVVVDASVRYFSTGKIIVCDRLHASILALLMNTPHVIIDGGPETSSYGKRLGTRSVAFETSEHCTQDSMRYRDASTYEEGVIKGIELFETFFT